MHKTLVVVMMVAAVGCGGRSVGQTVHHGPTALPPAEPAPPAASVAPPAAQPASATPDPATSLPTPEGFVVDASQAPVLAAGHGKAWITKLATTAEAFVGIIKMAPKAAIPEHQDTAGEYVYILSGGGELTMDGKTFTIGPQSFIFMPAGVTVSFQNGNAELVALQVFAPPGPAAKYDGWKPVER
ncbi:MAG: cupin domain-containing protein [Deltaproteobacteria bacterium]|nr:cupin domain-containing protein [Deltaproteobacteria bacterium]